MRIQDLPAECRPREKAREKGIGSLDDAELLALVIGSGTKGKSAVEMAQGILSEAGSLSKLSSWSYGELLGEEGAKEAKALSMLACFEIARRIASEDPDCAPFGALEAFLRFRGRMSKAEGESLYVALLSGSRAFLGERLIAKGFTFSLSALPEAVVEAVIGAGTRRFLLVHNHPSGLPLPSEEDLKANESLLEACVDRGVTFEDHVIISGHSYYSFRANHLL